jgi:hypothetical protein
MLVFGDALSLTSTKSALRPASVPGLLAYPRLGREAVRIDSQQVRGFYKVLIPHSATRAGTAQRHTVETIWAQPPTTAAMS